MKPTINDISYDKLLTNVAVDYQNDNYVCEQVAPTVQGKDGGFWYKYKKDKFRETDDLKAPGAKTNEVSHDMEKSGAYNFKKHALKELVTDELKKQLGGAFDAESDAVENIMNRLYVNKEKALADYMADSANITNNTTLSGDDQWDSYATSDPFTNIETARRAIHSSVFKDANVLLMGKNVYDDLKHHPDLLDRVKYTSRGVITTDMMESLFEVDRVIVAKAGYNTATEGQSDSMSYIWGKHAWLLHVAPNPGFKTVSFAYHFQDGQPRFVDKWRGSDGQDREGTWVRVRDWYVRKTVSTDCAYLIENAVS